MMEGNNTIHALAYFNLLKTGSWVEERIKAALKPFNLTHSQLNALSVLLDNDPEPVSVSELKEKMLVSNPDVTRLLDRLVKKEYVLRETCPDNRRKINITLTESGRELLIKAHNASKLAMGNFFEKKITENEAKELRRIMHKIRD